jgi:hypothetical protein
MLACSLDSEDDIDASSDLRDELAIFGAELAMFGAELAIVLPFEKLV